MTQYVIRRLIFMIPVIVGVSILVFALARILPGDVFTAQASSAGLSNETRQQLRQEAGLNRPFVVQYFDWAGHALKFDLGASLYNHQSVNKEIKRALPITFELTLLATIIGLAIALPLGVISAAMQGSVADYAARFISIIGLAVPSYVLGTLAVAYMAIWFHYAPPSGGISFFHDPLGNLEQFSIPALILGMGFAAAVMRMTRSTVLAVLREDYVRTARSKGLHRQVVLVRHVVRNALLPVLTLAGAQVGYLLGGTVIIETIFSLTGLGSLAYDAVTNRDYFMLQGITLLAAIVFTLLNLAVDVSYAWLDPRIRLS